FQQDTFYLYDALGQPRWVAGGVNAVSGSNTLAMSQLSGFCPLCNWVAAVPTPVGTLTASFASPTQGHYTTQINLAPPLAGSWNRLDDRRLSGRWSGAQRWQTLFDEPVRFRQIDLLDRVFARAKFAQDCALDFAAFECGDVRHARKRYHPVARHETAGMAFC